MIEAIVVVYLCLMVIGTISTIMNIGKDRDPITPATATLTVLIAVAAFYAILTMLMER